MNKIVMSRCLVAGMCVALLAAGCNKKRTTSPNDEATPDTRTAATASRVNFDGGTYCIQTITQGAPLAQTVHFTNKQSASDGSGKEFDSDLSGDKLDITYHERRKALADDKSMSAPAIDNGPIHVPARTVTVADGFADTVQTEHYNRSNSHEFVGGGNEVVQGGTPWELFVMKPDVKQIGSETINGWETAKFAVDTSHQSPLDKSPFLIAGKVKDYNITGTVWFAKDIKCVLQYTIDHEEDNTDGTVTKTHYEGSVKSQ